MSTMSAVLDSFGPADRLRVASDLLDAMKTSSSRFTLSSEQRSRLADSALKLLSHLPSPKRENVVAECDSLRRRDSKFSSYGTYCADAYLALGRRDDAETALESVLENGYLSWFDAPDLAARLLAIDGKGATTRAFELFDSKKGDLVWENENWRATSAAGPPEDLAMLTHFEEELSREAEAQAVSSTQAATERARELLTRIRSVKSNLKANTPSATLARNSVPIHDSPRSVLDASTVLLEYLLSDQKTYLFLVSVNEVRSFELPNRGSVTSLVEKIQSRSGFPNAGSVPTFNQDLAELSRILIGPAAKLILGKRLLIAPSGPLEHISFAGLHDPSFDVPTPLIQNHEITYIPSATVLGKLRESWVGRRSPSKTLAVIADPIFSPADPRVRRRSDEAGATNSKRDNSLVRAAVRSGAITGEDQQLARLPFTKVEADAILSYADPDKRLQATGFAANIQAVTAGKLADFRIVHFATHGFVNPTSDLSGLALTMVDTKGEPTRGFLKLYDIFKLKLPVDLVVLSACQTAVGLRSRFGTRGLPPGFFAAGAKRVVASLWRVDDAGTAQLMKNFYEAMLRDGLTPSAALRKAQLSMLNSKQWSDPYYWAGFGIHGEPN